MSELVDTTEMYLKAVWELEEDRVPPLRARIVERLHHTVPTVSQTIGRMERDGLLMVQPDRSIKLTPLGHGYAMRIMRKHRLAELLLTDVLGLPLRDVHDEACRWEHVMSKEAEERIVKLLASPYVDPFGNPVPGLAELEVETQPSVLGEPLELLLEAAADDEPVVATVIRLGEPLQADAEVLAELIDAGVVPGVEITVRNSELTVEGSQVPLPVSAHIARHLAVTR